MSDRSSRVLSFAGSSVRIDCDGLDAIRLVDFLFGKLASGEGPAPHVVLRVQVEPRRGSFTLHVDDNLYCQGQSLGSLAIALLGQTMFHLSDRSQGGLLLHAGAVSLGDRCVLLPGGTGAGKTSLTAWLTSKGFGYMTDELVYIPFGTDSVRPFVRPLSIKAAGRDALAQWVVDFEALAPQILGGPDITLVPHTVFGSPAAPTDVRLGAVVFPRYQIHAECLVAPVSKAQAGAALMGCLINARNLPGHGFAEVTRLVREAPACELHYGAFSQIEEWTQRLAQSDLTSLPSCHAPEGPVATR